MNPKLQNKLKIVRRDVTLFRILCIILFVFSFLFSMAYKSLELRMIGLYLLQIVVAYIGPKRMGSKNYDTVLGVKGTAAYQEGKSTLAWSVRMAIISLVVGEINWVFYGNKVEGDLESALMIMCIIIPLIGILVLIYCVVECKFYLMTDHKGTKKLKKVNDENVLETNITYLVNESSFSTESVEKVTADGKYILEDKDFKQRFGPKGTEYAKKVFHKCYLVELRSQEELQKRMDQAYEEYKHSTDGILHTITIVNFRTGQTRAINVPKEYRDSQVLNYVEIESISELNFDLIRKENSRGKTYSYTKKGFNQSRYYFQQVNEFTKQLGLKPEDKDNNDIISQFYDNARLFQNPLRSVMALLDYEEMVLRLISLYYFTNPKATIEIKENKLLQGNFLTMGQFISESAAIDGDRKERLERVYVLPDIMKDYISKLWHNSYITFEGDKINFYGLLSLTLAIRNKLIAHGTLNKDGEYLAWGVMFYATALLNEYLDVDHFKLIKQENGYRFGYEIQKESLIHAGKYIIESDGKPCFANTAATGKAKVNYINYFNGDLIVPNFEG